MLPFSFNNFIQKSSIFLLFCSFIGYAQYPVTVEQNLKIAGANRAELEKALTYAQKTGDPQKLKAMQFLIANMDIHYSATYYWQSATGQKIPYNEMDYPDFEQAAKAFEALKNQNPGMQPKPIIYKDLETIKGDYLIENLERSFDSWRNSPITNISFDFFCDYILPYRASVEPLQDWRKKYAEKFTWITEKIQANGFEASLPYIKDEANSWFSNTWSVGGRKEPLPRLGSMQLLLRKQGPCEDLADLGVFTMRAVGIPAAVNVIPYWATTKGGHFVNSFFGSNQKPIPFDYGDNNEKLKREPAKVLRYTYSKQPDALASIEDSNNIPKGFLQEPNIIDVTNEYWPTTNVNCSLFPDPSNSKTVYIATFNGLNWRTFWWGKIKNNQAQLSQISKGTVILPQYYSNQKMIPASDPILVGDKENRILTPDFAQQQSITISSLAGYLLIKPKVTYKLFYWNKSWQLIDTKIADENTQSFVYEKAPKNALFLLVASDSKGFERPFVVIENGERSWY